MSSTTLVRVALDGAAGGAPYSPPSTDRAAGRVGTRSVNATPVETAPTAGGQGGGRGSTYGSATPTVVAHAALAVVDARGLFTWRTHTWHTGFVAPCPFCEIVAGRSPAKVVADWPAAVAFLDRSPLFPGHVLVVPREHVVTLADLPAADVGPYFTAVQRVSAVMPGAMGADGSFVAMNNAVSQSVAHLHTHVVPRRRKDGLRGFFWPRQRYADGAEIERVADSLRRALSGG